MATYLSNYKCPNCFNTNFVSALPVALLTTNNVLPKTTINATATAAGIPAGSFLHCSNCMVNFTDNVNYP